MAPKQWHSQGLPLFDTGCVDTRMGRTTLQMSARQSEEASSRPGVREEGCTGHMEQEANTTQQVYPMLCSSPQRALHNRGTHAGHPPSLADELGAGQESRAVSACLTSFWLRHGLDAGGAGGRQCSPRRRVLRKLPEGRARSTYLTTSALVSFLKGSIKCNSGEGTPSPNIQEALLPLVQGRLQCASSFGELR